MKKKKHPFKEWPYHPIVITPKEHERMLELQSPEALAKWRAGLKEFQKYINELASDFYVKSFEDKEKK